MANLIMNSNDFNPTSQLRFTKPKVNSVGGKSVGILNSTVNKSVYLSTPLIRCWGANKRENANGDFSYDVSIQFDTEAYSTKEQTEFLSKLVEFEDYIKECAKTYSKDWFNKPSMSDDVVDALFHPILKYPKDKDTDMPDKTRAPSMKIKLPTWEGEYKFELYDVDQNILLPGENPEHTPDVLIEKGSNIACVIQCGGLWFASGKFGVTWKLVQAIVKPSDNVKPGKCYIQLSASDRETLSNQKSSKTEEATTYASDGEDVEDVEEEEKEVQQSSEDEPEPEPEPEPVKKKGGRRKRT